MVGTDMSKENVVDLVAQWADKRPDVRTFSRLTSDDFNKLCKSIYDIVNINDDVLCQRVPDSIIPPQFLPMLRISRLVSSRRTEMGTKKIINLFLDVAVYVARIVFEGEDRLVIHHEWETEPTEIPEIGVVGGPLNYITSRAAGRVNMGARLHVLLLICDRDIDDRTRHDNGLYRKTVYGGYSRYKLRYFLRGLRRKKFPPTTNLAPLTSTLFLSSTCRFKKSKIILTISPNFKLTC